MKRVVVIAGVVLMSLSLVACAGDEPAAEDGTTQEADENAEQEDSGEGAAGSVTAENATFDPELITVAAGGSIEFVNRDNFEHSFTVRDSDVSEELEGVGAVSVDLSALEPGSYDFFCEYHPDTMEGTLEVTP